VKKKQTENLGSHFLMIFCLKGWSRSELHSFMRQFDARRNTSCTLILTIPTLRSSRAVIDVTLHATHLIPIHNVTVTCVQRPPPATQNASRKSSGEQR